MLQKYITSPRWKKCFSNLSFADHLTCGDHNRDTAKEWDPFFASFFTVEGLAHSRTANFRGGIEKPESD